MYDIFLILCMHNMVHNYYPNITKYYSNILFYTIVTLLIAKNFFQKKLNNFKELYFDVISFFL